MRACCSTSSTGSPLRSLLGPNGFSGRRAYNGAYGALNTHLASSTRAHLPEHHPPKDRSRPLRPHPHQDRLPRQDQDDCQDPCQEDDLDEDEGAETACGPSGGGARGDVHAPRTPGACWAYRTHRSTSLRPSVFLPSVCSSLSSILSLLSLSRYTPFYVCARRTNLALSSYDSPRCRATLRLA